jgi:large subunit ribosomal protein L21
MIPQLRPAVQLLRQCCGKEAACIQRMSAVGEMQLRQTSTSTSAPPFPPPNPIPLADTRPKPISLKTETKACGLSPLLNTSDVYMTVHINNFPYLISANDTLHLPFHLPDVPLGGILRMNKVSRIGCRDYTLEGHPFIDEKLYTLKMRVIEHTKQPLVITVKKKRRQRRARHLPNKQNYTVLK